jgi:hypothetical protein
LSRRAAYAARVKPHSFSSALLVAVVASFGAWRPLAPQSLDQDDRATSRPASAPAAARPEAPQDDAKPLGPGYRWRGPVRPTAANEVFATGDGCSMCHSTAPGARAMRTATGDDVSPYGLWQASLMANAFRDPYFRAQLERESLRDPENAESVQALCLRCHAPMAHHTARLGGEPALTLATAKESPLAADGVSCTVCHQIRPEGLGTPETFHGRPRIEKGRIIYGPYADPAEGPMRMHAGYTPTEGAHLKSSGHCASCHTLFTRHTGGEFPEQTPFLEWRNSAFTDEGGRTETSKTCQECHMPRSAPTKIARNPMGRDFNIPVREDYGAHLFVGGNAFMLDLLRQGAERLGVKAPAAAFERLAAATRKQLAEDTAALEISPVKRGDGRVAFTVTASNRTGHKFPTGYPSRRAWLRVEVRSGDDVLFRSGAYDAAGRLTGVADERAIPHYDRITESGQVVVYECVPVDAAGKPTTMLTAMAKMGKDTRLLPRGWRRDGPHVDATAPVGVDGDADFVGGSDVVHFDVPAKVAADETLTIVAWLLYQPIPPSWVEPFRGAESPDATTFLSLYDAAEKTPDVAALAVRIDE